MVACIYILRPGQKQVRHVACIYILRPGEDPKASQPLLLGEL